MGLAKKKNIMVERDSCLLGSCEKFLMHAWLTRVKQNVGGDSK